MLREEENITDQKTRLNNKKIIIMCILFAKSWAPPSSFTNVAEYKAFESCSALQCHSV